MWTAELSSSIRSPSVLLLAMLLFACGDQATAPESQVGVVTSDGLTQVETDQFSVAISSGQPFGVVSLRMRDQPGDFAHWEFPLGDWEWLWFGDADTVRSKLIDPVWNGPKVSRTDTSVVLAYSRKSVILDGLDLAVTYTFGHGPDFDIEYAIKNGSGTTIAAPYSMLGFPGFSNHRWIDFVATNLEPRSAPDSLQSYWEDAVARQVPEYTLLRDDVSFAHAGLLSSVVAYAVLGEAYLLSSELVDHRMISTAFSAHVNKPGYLTSHIYVTYEDLVSIPSCRCSITHAIGRNGLSPVALQ
ncbi:MAG: hypothetical protein HOC05_02355 [Gemmatimonadetes bacterium]|jgi:hypothetical protein|nr:hypothetical protein [Gemmatimonadota bacterium]MBT4608853.1 hypothetical protein [Gemmatimonadota bacterium]MBT5964263.1 hypothetical protein [Gemmatimonadota bacterium]MBT7595573.1 hypothetical protein [Gemmatimonadota bacterium]